MSSVQLFSQLKKPSTTKAVFDKEKRFQVKNTNPNKTLFYTGVS